MQTKVICNAMITVKEMVVAFWFVKCNKGNIFVFSKLIITGNKNIDKVNEKLIWGGPIFS
jgi:hypothetical protein